ncbi:MAG: serine/threonine protein kinase [Proteobacteria bacterium]|nr:serine/threonine protein kinase [Pseudomonadota bacterium]
MLERIGNCRIVEEVASGGMAVVYRAIQEPMGRVVAIKALKTSAASEENVATRFEREAKSLANLQHENIIHVYDFHQERGAMFIVMEYVQGIDLYDLLEKGGRLPYDVATIIGMQVARALDYVHYRGIIHRDIKPANIMISRSGGVKLMDFGIARDTSFGDLTEQGTGIGTPAYMSPEQVLGDRLDARSDLFSLGVVLYQMVTGTKPFIEDEKKSAMHKIRLEKHTSVRKLNPDIPRELANIIDRALEKQPRDRWRSAQHMVMALERFLAKHVEMNHHARLVLFLRAQSVITELEADEYLNPAALGVGASVLAQPNMMAKNAVRSGIVAHAVTLGMLLLMLGLIHVAPLGATPQTTTITLTQQLSHYRVRAYPWATIAIDGRTIGVTPLDKPLTVPAGKHVVRFEHEYYVPVDRTIEFEANSDETAQAIAIDFEKDRIKLRDGKTRPPDANEPPPSPEPPAAGSAK